MIVIERWRWRYNFVCWKSINTKCIEIDEKYELISLIFEAETNTDIALIAAYRPSHYRNEDQFLANLTSKVLKLDEITKDTIIIGDLNFNLLESNNKLINFNNTRVFKSVVSKGTMLNPATFVLTLLDVILCYCQHFFIASDTFPYPRSDHLMVSSALNFKKPKPAQML
jgi:hypothetical protein